VIVLTVYGIPTCDSCRKARKWLDAQGHAHAWVDLRKTPPDGQTVAGWVAALGAKKLKNTSGGSYRALPADKADWSDAQWTDAYASDPMLLKRPVLVRDGTAITTGFKGWDALL
jgi:arsenate reductase